MRGKRQRKTVLHARERRRSSGSCRRCSWLCAAIICCASQNRDPGQSFALVSPCKFQQPNSIAMLAAIISRRDSITNP